MKWMQWSGTVAGGLILTGLILTSTTSPGEAQSSSPGSTTSTPQNRPSPEELQAIREAPFSQVFTASNAYAVKDQDYQGSDEKLGVRTLWVDFPEQNRLVVVVKYCVIVFVTIKNRRIRQTP